MIIKVRRQWKDWRVAEVDFNDLSNLHWDNFSGGVQQRTPRPFIHAFVMCDKINGDLAHSCMHGEGPHSIKVCILKVDNQPATFKKIKEIVGESPKTILKL